MSAETDFKPGLAARRSARPTKPRRLIERASWIIVTLVVIACLIGVKADWSDLLGLPQQFVIYLGRLFGPPAWSRAGDALSAMMLSVAMAWIGTVIAAIISLPLSFLGTKGLAPAWIRVPVRVVFAALRAVPEVIIAILILTVTGLTPFTGALALGVTSIGTLGKWGSEAFENVDRRVIESVRATGATPLDTARWAFWPAAATDVIAFWLYRFEISVRASTILGLIGAGGIGKMLADNVQFRNWDVVGMIVIVVIVVTMIVDQISGAVRHRILNGRWAVPGFGRRRRARIAPRPI